MSDYIKANVGTMTVIERGRERTVNTWAHRRPTADELEARKRIANLLRARLVKRIAEGRRTWAMIAGQ